MNRTDKIILAHYYIYLSPKKYCELEPYINMLNEESEHVKYIPIQCSFLEDDTIYVPTKSIEETENEAIKKLEKTGRFLQKLFE